MATPLLTTKLYIPPVRPELVSRPHLIERLNTGLHRRLTLVSAPASFGKTTLLSEWATGCGRPVAWVSLDEGDNDPTRFWSYLSAALQKAQSGIGETALTMLRSTPPPAIEAILTTLINEITARSLKLVLVLDDYQMIKEQSIHESLAFLLDHLPPQMHLGLATRIDPPLNIARLRVRGQVTELRAGDLRFTPDEAASFLNQVMGLGLSQEAVAALEARTEGWIAGLQVAAMAMQGRDDLSGFVAAFTGSHRYILSYLVEEVLQRQPEHTRIFLLQTAILDRLNGSLCDAVADRSGSQETLELLEDTNLFIVPLDDERRWYRYHRLFSDALRVRLEREFEAHEIQTLHRRASDWYDQHGFVLQGINHALDTQDYERAAQLIERRAEEIFQGSELNTVNRFDIPLVLELTQRMLPYVDDDTRPYLYNRPADLRPVVIFDMALAYEFSAQVDAASQAFADAAESSRERRNQFILLMAMSHLAQLQVLQGQLRAAEKTCRQALHLLDRLGLGEKLDSRYDELSTGLQRRLALALALAHEPPVLFLDEPTAGLDVGSRAELHALMQELRAGGATIILATHDMAEAEKMTDRVAILLQGKIVATGSPRELTVTGAGFTKVSVRTEQSLLAADGMNFPAVSQRTVKDDYVIYFSTNPGPTVSAILQYIGIQNDQLIDLRVERPSLEERFLEITNSGGVQ